MMNDPCVLIQIKKSSWEKPQCPGFVLAEPLDHDERQDDEEIPQHLRAESERRKSKRAEQTGNGETCFGIPGPQRPVEVQRNHYAAAQDDQESVKSLQADETGHRAQQHIAKPLVGDPGSTCNSEGIGIDGRPIMRVKDALADLDMPPHVRIYQKTAPLIENRGDENRSQHGGEGENALQQRDRLLLVRYYRWRASLRCRRS